MIRVAVMRFAVLWVGLLACSSSEPFERSCNGKTVPNCLPYELSILESAVLEPERVTIEDPTQTVDVRIQLMRCDMLDRAHEVTIELRAGSEEMPRILDLVTVRDDGMDGDATAMDGVIEKTIENPFFGAEIPANADVFLRYQARAPADCSSGMCIGGTCRSETLEVPYRTGDRFDPDA